MARCLSPPALDRHPYLGLPLRRHPWPPPFLPQPPLPTIHPPPRILLDPGPRHHPRSPRRIPPRPLLILPKTRFSCNGWRTIPLGMERIRSRRLMLIPWAPSFALPIRTSKVGRFLIELQRRYPRSSSIAPRPPQTALKAPAVEPAAVPPVESPMPIFQQTPNKPAIDSGRSSSEQTVLTKQKQIGAKPTSLTTLE